MRFIMDLYCSQSASKDLIAAGFDDEVIMKFKSHFDTCVKLSHVTTVLDVDSPYTTIVHRDLWTNNIMTKRSKYFAFKKFKEHGIFI